MATPAEQFANDWTLIMENNDETSYAELMETAKSAKGTYPLAETLRDEWETLCEQVKETVEENISTFASELVNQILNYWGIEPFMIIARDLMERVEENAKYEDSLS